MVGQKKWGDRLQGILGLHEFWAREKLVQAKFVLVKFLLRTIQGMVYIWKFLQVKFMLVKIVQAKDPLNSLKIDSIGS